MVEEQITTENGRKSFMWYSFLALVSWTTLIVFSLFLNFRDEHERTLELAHMEALTTFNKDLAFRRWATKHGGVYVPVSSETPANPYLAHLPGRDITTPQGIPLTLMNPAYMLRQVMADYAELSGTKGHLTSLKLLNPENKAGEWEVQALQALEEGAEEVVGEVLFDGASYLRMIRPLTTQAGCLKCHEEQGYQEGDVHGGLAIAVPLARYLGQERQARTHYFKLHLFFWLLGVVAIGFGRFRLKMQLLERKRYEERLLAVNKELDGRVQERTAVLVQKNKELGQEVVERQEAEKALFQVEQRFRYLFEQAPLPYQSLAEDGSVLDVNVTWLEVMGYEREEVVGRAFTDFIPVEYHARFGERFPLFKAAGEIHGVEMALLRKDGQVILVEFTGRITRENGPDSLQTHCIFRDITEQRKVEEQEANLSKIVEDSLNEIYIFDATSLKFVLVNGGARRNLGYTLEELQALTPVMLKQGMTSEEFAEIIKPLRDDREKEITFEAVHTRKDGSIYQVEVHLQKAIYRSATVFVAMIQDISERLQVEEELKELSDQLSLLLESLPVVVYTRRCDGDLGITFVSGRIEEFTGFTPEQFVQEPNFWFDHLHPDDQARMVPELPTVLHQHRFLDSYRFQVADGSYKWFSCTRRLLKSADGTDSHIVGTWQDISEEKKLQTESNQRLQQVIQADKLSSLGEVVAGVAHEINNPNSFISYNVPLLEDIWKILEPLIEEKVASAQQTGHAGLSVYECYQDMGESIEAIKVGSERINKVVSNLKDFARLDEGDHTSEVDIREMVEKIYTIVGAQLRKLCSRVEVNLDVGIPPVVGHSQKLEQVVANLLLNGAHAVQHKDDGRLKLSARYLDWLQAVVLVIEDNGHGMAPETMSRIFEPFFTTKRECGGTGLGLSVSYGLIQEHNGRIAVLSREGLGTSFTLFIPLDHASLHTALHPKILLIAEKEELATLRLEFMDYEGLEVLTMADPQNLSSYLLEHPEVDIVISDLHHPSLSGWDLLRQLKKGSPLISVALYTDEPGEMAENPTDYEVDYVLPRPFRTKHVLEFLQTIPRIRL